MKKIFLLLAFGFFLSGCEIERPPAEIDVNKINMVIESNLALEEADRVYNRAVAEGKDLSNGPCLSNELFGNPNYPEVFWVLDIVHQPRQEIDDLPENQCQAFKEGRAYNFIELNEEGKLIRLYSPLLEKQKANSNN